MLYLFSIWFIRIFLLFVIVSAIKDNDNVASCTSDISRLIVLLTTILLVVTPAAFGERKKKDDQWSPHIKRKRKFVWQIFRELGPTYVRQAYRMDEDSFIFFTKSSTST